MPEQIFQLPAGTPQQQLAHCLKIICVQRDELLPIRRKLNTCQLQKFNADKAIDHWKKKYSDAEAEIRKLKEEKKSWEKEKEKLQEEIEKLTKTNNRYQVSLFDHGNFKSQDTTQKKEKGGQPGHADTNREAREEYASYQQLRLYARMCGKCQRSLNRVTATRQKVLIDIVINPQVIKVILASERQWCGNCKCGVTVRDERSLPFTEYGMNTFMLTMLLRFKCHASLANIASVISLSHGLTLSKSDVSNLLKSGTKYLGKRYKELQEAIRRGAVMYLDETGWLYMEKKPGCGSRHRKKKLSMWQRNYGGKVLRKKYMVIHKRML